MKRRNKPERHRSDDDITVEAMEPRLLLSADALGIDAGVLDQGLQQDMPWDIEQAADWWAPEVDAQAEGSSEFTLPGGLPSPIDSIDLAADTAAPAVDCDCLDAVETAPVQPASSLPGSEIVFVDAAVGDVEQLLSDLVDGRDAGSTEIYLIDGASDGVDTDHPHPVRADRMSMRSTSFLTARPGRSSSAAPRFRPAAWMAMPVN